MKIKVLRQMSVAELKQKLVESRREHLTLRIQRVSQQLKNPLNCARSAGVLPEF